ncbi:hypothetical protein LCGC14_0996240 [marine sediment metagenome]|uniref:Uncharacterized protein n=1 Tax=marine sediment metagenome TaxID=412755 RepID=A0A0F9N8Z1_9ZZZZ
MPLNITVDPESLKVIMDALGFTAGGAATAGGAWLLGKVWKRRRAAASNGARPSPEKAAVSEELCEARRETIMARLEMVAGKFEDTNARLVENMELLESYIQQGGDG